MHGKDGNDVLVGGADNDILYGGAGSDVYIYNKGDGDDVIDDYQFNKAGGKVIDTLKFGEGIAAEDINIVRESDDVLLELQDGSIRPNPRDECEILL